VTSIRLARGAIARILPFVRSRITNAVTFKGWSSRLNAFIQPLRDLQRLQHVALFALAKSSEL